jgi:hypothetical protein
MQSRPGSWCRLLDGFGEWWTRPPAPRIDETDVHPTRGPVWQQHRDRLEDPVTTIGKTAAELAELVNAALRNQPGCATAMVTGLVALPNAPVGRSWEIPNVILGDSLISDVDRAVITVHHQLGRKYHLMGD